MREEIEKLVRAISNDDNAKFHPQGYADRIEALIVTSNKQLLQRVREKGPAYAKAQLSQSTKESQCSHIYKESK